MMMMHRFATSFGNKRILSLSSASSRGTQAAVSASIAAATVRTANPSRLSNPSWLLRGGGGSAFHSRSTTKLGMTPTTATAGGTAGMIAGWSSNGTSSRTVSCAAAESGEEEEERERQLLSFPESILQYDHYNGVAIHLEDFDEGSSSNSDTQSTPTNNSQPLSSFDFDAALKSSLEQWTADGRKGIWLHIPTAQSDKIHAAMAQGFDFHMVVSDNNHNSNSQQNNNKLILSKWLPTDTPSRLPLGPTHQVGVGCLVFQPDDPSKMLVVQEKTGPAAAAQLWKMPTGLADPGEDIHDAAVRELREETGLNATFEGVILLRQAHSTRPVAAAAAASSTQQRPSATRANSDLFFVCVLKLVVPPKNEQDDDEECPLDDLFQACPEEIAAIQWMPVDEYCAQERWQVSPIYLELNQALLNHSERLVAAAKGPQQEEQNEQENENLWPACTLPLGFGRGTNTVYKCSRL